MKKELICLFVFQFRNQYDYDVTVWSPQVSFLLSVQGSHRLEKYLNLEGFLEKSLKIKIALKSTGK